MQAQKMHASSAYFRTLGKVYTSLTSDEDIAMTALLGKGRLREAGTWLLVVERDNIIQYKLQQNGDIASRE